MAIIGIDLGGTKISGAVFYEDSIYSKESVLVNQKAGDEVAIIISGLIAKIIIAAKEKEIIIEAIGISIPGIYRTKTKTVWAPNIKGWDDFPLWNYLNAKFPTIPVFIDSDRACSILGEKWKGNAQKYSNAIFMAVGTGIGAGILIDNFILRGSEDIAGAIGWWALNKPFENKYISCGNFEYFASGEGLARYTNELLAKASINTNLKLPVTSHQIFEFHDSDNLAKEVIKNAIEYWGMAAANLVSIFNPEVIIWGGGLFGPAVKFIPDIYDEAKRWAQPISIKSVKFIKSDVGPDAALFGAAYLALTNI